jgi:hypothetical protein
MTNQGGRIKNDAGDAQRQESNNEKQTNAIVRISEQLVASPWVRRFAQLGYGAKGLLYLIIGTTAVLALVNVGQGVRGTRGALNLIVASPFGRLGVAFVAVGLGGFILRRLVQIFVSPKIGTAPKRFTRISRRMGYVLSGLGHLGIALAALQLMFGLTTSGRGEVTPARIWILRLLTSMPMGSSWIVLFGLVIVGVGIFQFYLAVSRRFAVELQLEQMSQRVRKMTIACGVAGYAGRGLAFLFSGTFLIYTGFVVEVAEGGRFGNTVNTIEIRPPGAWTFFAAAAGLTAYGLYLLFAARYLRLIATW